MLRFLPMDTERFRTRAAQMGVDLTGVTDEQIALDVDHVRAFAAVLTGETITFNGVWVTRCPLCGNEHPQRQRCVG